mgnify:CR=1 FL=1
MAKPRDTFKLGLTLIVFLVLFAGVIVFIGTGIRGGGETVVVRFPADQITAKLKKGGEVLCGGQSVGTIRSIHLQEESAAEGPPRLYVHVTIDVDRVVGLRDDCRITPTAALIGDVSALEITNRGVGSPISRGGVVMGHAAPGLSTAIGMLTEQLDPNRKDSLLSMIRGQLDVNNTASLLAKVHKSLNDLNDVTQSVSFQMNANERQAIVAKLHTMLDHVNAATASLRGEFDPKQGEAALARIHTALDSLNRALVAVVATLDENRPTVRETMQLVRNTARILSEQIAPRVAAEVDVKNTASLLAELHVGMARMNEALADIKGITAAGRTLVVANKDSIEKIIANLLDTSERIKVGIQDLTLHPWRLFKQPTPDEEQRQGVVDAARLFSQAATQLDNATIRLKAVVDAGGGRVRPDDEGLIQARDALQHTIEQFQQAEQALWKQLEVRSR